MWQSIADIIFSIELALVDISNQIERVSQKMKLSGLTES